MQSDAERSLVAITINGRIDDLNQIVTLPAVGIYVASLYPHLTMTLLK